MLLFFFRLHLVSSTCTPIRPWEHDLLLLGCTQQLPRFPISPCFPPGRSAMIEIAGGTLMSSGRHKGFTFGSNGVGKWQQLKALQQSVPSLELTQIVYSSWG